MIKMTIFWKVNTRKAHIQLMMYQKIHGSRTMTT